MILPYLTHVPDIPANLLSAGIARTVEDVVAKAAIVQLAVAPSAIIGDQISAARNLTAEYSTFSRGRLMTWRSAWKPNSTSTRRRHMTRRNVKFVIVSRHGSSCRNQKSSGK